jgi:DNA processing protein
MQEDLFYLLALQKVKGVGDISAKKLLKYFGSAKLVFEAAKKNEIEIPEIGTYITNQIKQFNDFERVEKEIKYIKDHNISTISIFDEDYPHHLFHSPDGPILFFKKGNFKLHNRKIISIVGTRNITPYGKRMIEEIIDEIKDYNPIIVSGLAYGVDVTTHRQALKNNLETIGVLGHGFQRIYPAIHNKIAMEMLHQGGLITEFWHTDIIDRNNFLKRNRIIAGISEATVIIESGEKGGSLVTADIANSYNRDVFAVPGRATDTYSKGCNNLIKSNKAQLITSGKDIIEMLGWKHKETAQTTPQLNLFVDLTEDEQKIFDLLNEKGKSGLDEIAIALGFPISKTAQLLLQMELNNIVSGLTGKQFELI